MVDKYSRENLIMICERAVVPHKDWSDRDSYFAQIGVGQAWSLLKAGAPFEVMRGDFACSTDDQTIWIKITCKGFAAFDYGGADERKTYYLPTDARLTASEGGDWY